MRQPRTKAAKALSWSAMKAARGLVGDLAGRRVDLGVHLAG